MRQVSRWRQRPRQNSTGAHAVVSSRSGAIDRDLHTLDCERREPVGRRVVDATAVRLELQRHPGVGKKVEDFPAMRHTERFASTEGHIRDAEVGDSPRHVERFVAAQLIAPGLVGSRFLATGDAARAAAIGQLPGKNRGARYSSTARPSMNRSNV